MYYRMTQRMAMLLSLFAYFLLSAAFASASPAVEPQPDPVAMAAGEPAESASAESASVQTPKSTTVPGAEGVRGVAESASGVPAAAPRTEEEQALRKRVEARWEAVLAMDFDRVYSFSTPAYRQAYNKMHFFNRYGGQVKRNRIKILRVEFVDEQAKEAIVHLDIYYNLVPDFGKPVETTSYEKEAWVKVDGEWWRVEPR